MANIQTILKACRIGDLTLLESAMLESPECVDETDNKLGWTGLYCSVMCGHVDITKFLLQNNADVNLKNRMGETALHQAVECKNLKMAKILLKHRADPNSQQNDGETPLHIAIVKNDHKIVCELLMYNADPNIPNFVYGKTAVHYAMELNNSKIIEELLKFKPNFFIRDKLGNTPMDSGKAQNPELMKSISRISPEVSELNYFSQISPSYTRCNSDTSLFAESRSIDMKIKQIEMMHKKIRETVRTSVDTIKRFENSCGSAAEMDTDRSGSERRATSCERKPELYTWLKSLRLSSEYDLLVSSGYDDIKQLIKQMRSSIPLNEKSLIRIGMTRPGHRRKLLAALDSLANKSSDTGILNQLQCCLAFPYNILGNDAVTIEKWLEELSLEELYGVFKDSGFEDFEDIRILVNTPWAVDDTFLMDIGIEKPGHRHRILAKIREMTSGRRSDELIIEKNYRGSDLHLMDVRSA